MLIGTGAELLHLASVLPETWAHKSRPWKLDAEEDGPSPSCENPWGQPDESKPLGVWVQEEEQQQSGYGAK
ncbi:hypothetical protein HaLaN_14281 [Haematococcus lacustris]|uniref:Uncharacterized protein n=1 Tax=Haematococcus lacustris TaxID=44745 RepID=A0A699ZNZ8_HAELA|nr:hypothetical protein HaLaN_14281 [Haematococcus lacustris]